MAGPNLANAYITLIPSMRGAQSAISKDFLPAAEKAGRAGGKKLGSATVAAASFTGIGTKLQTAGKSIGDFGGSLTKKITLPALGAASAVAGIGLAGGWKRLVSIENSEAALKGLGYTAKEASDIIRTDVLAAVEGTAFSLSEAGSAAAGALGAGIQPGEELTRWMTAVGDATQQSNTDFNSMANIMAKVKGKGALMSDTITQMTENGLYIVPMLSKEFGKTADEIYAMASAGEISADMMQQALENQIGGSAKNAGDTTEGALANMKSAFSNLGATVLTEVMPGLKEGLADLTESFKSPEMKEFAGTVGTAIADVFEKIIAGIKKAVDWWKNLSPGMKDFVTKLGLAAVAAGPLLVGVGKLTRGFGLLFKGAGLVTGAISAVTTALGLNSVAAFKSKLETLALAGMYAKEFVVNAAKAVGSIVATTAAWVAHNTALVAVKIAQGAATAAQWLFNAAMNANPILLVVTAISALVAGLVWFFTQTELGQQIWQGFVDWLVAAWEWVRDTAIGIWTAVSEFFVGLWEGISSAAVTAWTAVTEFLSKIWNGLKNTVVSVFTGVATFFTNIWTGIQTTAITMWNALVGAVTSIWNGLATTVSNIFTGIAGALSGIWEGIKTTASNAVNWVKSTVVSVWENMKTAAVNVFEGMKKAIDTVWSGVKKVAAAPINFIINTVWNDGIAASVEKVAGWLGFDLSLPKMTPVKFAEGGVFPGYAPGHDSILAMYSPGEGVLVPEAVKGLGGPSFVHWANRHFSGGRSNGGHGQSSESLSGIPAFSEGGGFWDGVGKFLTNPFGSIADWIVNPALEMLSNVSGSKMVAEIGKGAIKKAINFIPDWFFGQSEEKMPKGIAQAAQGALGVPYVWGGSSIPPGLDCSGLVYWAAQQLGLGWPRLTAAGYQSASRSKNMAQAIPGDLLFWGNPAHHVGIFTGPGQMIHAPQPGDYVRNAPIYGSPSAGTYSGGGGTGMRSTYAGLVENTARRSSSPEDYARSIRRQQYDVGGTLHPGWTLAYNGTGKPETVRTFEQEHDFRTRSGRFVLVVDEAGGFRELARGEIEEVLGPVSSGALMSRNGVG